MKNQREKAAAKSAQLIMRKVTVSQIKVRAELQKINTLLGVKS